MQQYLLEYLLSTRFTTKVSLALCESIVRYKNIPKKKFKERDLFFVSIEIVSESGYYGIVCLYRIIHDLKTPLFLVA